MLPARRMHILLVPIVDSSMLHQKIVFCPTSQLPFQDCDSCGCTQTTMSQRTLPTAHMSSGDDVCRSSGPGISPLRISSVVNGNVAASRRANHPHDLDALHNIDPLPPAQDSALGQDALRHFTSIARAGSSQDLLGSQDLQSTPYADLAGTVGGGAGDGRGLAAGVKHAAGLVAPGFLAVATEGASRTSGDGRSVQASSKASSNHGDSRRLSLQTQRALLRSKSFPSSTERISRSGALSTTDVFTKVWCRAFGFCLQRPSSPLCPFLYILAHCRPRCSDTLNCKLRVPMFSLFMALVQCL